MKSLLPVRFHPRVQLDLDHALKYYSDISQRLEDDFWAEFQTALEKIQTGPERFHFDTSSKLRRFNLKQFPYNILYRIYDDRIRIQVIRHNQRNRSFGLRRKQ